MLSVCTHAYYFKNKDTSHMYTLYCKGFISTYIVALCGSISFLQTQKLVEVTSNIWGTKFKIHGLASFLPEDMGQVLYKTSLLHLQPRQMTVSILEVTHDLRPEAYHDPNYNPNQFSESEDEIGGIKLKQNMNVATSLPC